MQIAQMLSSSPITGPHADLSRVAQCIEACLDCVATCTSCADSCLNEPMDLRMCISANLACADVCAVTARALSRPTVPSMPLLRALLTTCMLACRSCADECERHEHEHCRICAQACRRCEALCLELARGITP